MPVDVIADGGDGGTGALGGGEQGEGLRRCAGGPVVVGDAMPAPLRAQVLAQQLAGARVEEADVDVVPLHVDAASDPAGRRRVVAAATSMQRNRPDAHCGGRTGNSGTTRWTTGRARGVLPRTWRRPGQSRRSPNDDRCHPGLRGARRRCRGGGGAGRPETGRMPGHAWARLHGSGRGAATRVLTMRSRFRGGNGLLCERGSRRRNVTGESAARRLHWWHELNHPVERPSLDVTCSMIAFLTVPTSGCSFMNLLTNDSASQPVATINAK